MSRPRRRIAVTLAFLLAPLVLVARGEDEASRSGPGAPNIVLISVDTLNPASLRAYRPDAAERPNLDTLAARSVRFRSALSGASWTLPAHASLLTGLYPDRHGATDPRRRIDADARTLAQDLRDAGYETVAFTDGGYLAGAFGFDAGFTIYDRASTGGSVDVASLPRGGAPNPLRGATLFDRAVAYLQARDARAPLFLFVHTYSVHDYFRLHPWALREVPGAGASGSAHLARLLGRIRAPDESWEQLRALYEAEIDHLDDALGGLLETLDAELGKRTIVVFVSDHGEGFDPEAGRIHHGGRLDRDVLRVPLLISGPGIAARDVDTPVSLVDVMPTPLDLAGAPPAGDLDGRSLTPVLRDSTAKIAPAPLFAMEHYHRWAGGRRLAAPAVQADPLAVAVVDGADWFVAAAGEDGTAESRYDVQADPEQRTDLGGDGDRAAALRTLIQQRLRPLPEATPAEPDSALQAELRSLGYVE